MIVLVPYILYFGIRARESIAFAVCNILAFITILFTLDQTRVFALVIFPVWLLLITSPAFLGLEAQEREFFKRLFAYSLIAGLLVPRIVVWDGNIYSSVFFQSITYVLGKLY
jgi:hypothetical protein